VQQRAPCVARQRRPGGKRRLGGLRGAVDIGGPPFGDPGERLEMDRRERLEGLAGSGRAGLSRDLVEDAVVREAGEVTLGSGEIVG